MKQNMGNKVTNNDLIHHAFNGLQTGSIGSGSLTNKPNSTSNNIPPVVPPVVAVAATPVIATEPEEDLKPIKRVDPRLLFRPGVYRLKSTCDSA